MQEVNTSLGNMARRLVDPLQELSTRRQWNDTIDTIRCKRHLINTTIAISDFTLTLRDLAFVIIEDVSNQCMNKRQRRTGMIIRWGYGEQPIAQTKHRLP
jgi:hypothetical protein